MRRRSALPRSTETAALGARRAPGAPTRVAALGVFAALAVLALATGLSGCSSSSVASGPRGSSGHRAATTTAPVTIAPTTAVVPTTTTTTDPGALPQTMAEPTTTDPVFQDHVQELWRAVVDGNPAGAMAFFFPLSAYVQVKAIADPVHDYETRLVANFDSDVMTDHAALGPEGAGAQFTSVAVPATPVWVLPGSEYNKGSYWRVYNSTVTYSVGGRPGSFEVASMISWRGEWYVVHLSSIR